MFIIDHLNRALRRNYGATQMKGTWLDILLPDRLLCFPPVPLREVVNPRSPLRLSVCPSVRPHSFTHQPLGRASSASCCPRGRAVWGSTWPLPTPWSSSTQTGTPTTTSRSAILAPSGLHLGSESWLWNGAECFSTESCIQPHHPASLRWPLGESEPWKVFLRDGK